MSNVSKFTFLIIMLFFFCPVAQLGAAKDVIDQAGRNVNLPDDPQRVVSLAPSITEIVFALEQEHRLKGVTLFSDFPPQARAIPRVGSYVQLDLERIVALRPDLCIATKDGNPKETIDRLVALNIPVYAVDPKNLGSVMETILEIGSILDAPEKANALVKSMYSRIQKIKVLVEQSTITPGVFYQIGVSPIVSAGTHTFIHELIVLAGGKNLAQGPVTYPQFSREQVLVLSPEVFIISSMARAAVFEQVKREWCEWPGLPAVRNQRIFLVDSDILDRPTPRLVEGLELLTRLIHPELFEEAK